VNFCISLYFCFRAVRVFVVFIGFFLACCVVFCFGLFLSVLDLYSLHPCFPLLASFRFFCYCSMCLNLSLDYNCFVVFFVIYVVVGFDCV